MSEKKQNKNSSRKEKTMHKLTINSDYTKTYKTEANLDKALEKLNLPDGLRYLCCCDENGRFTAVFVNTAHVENGVYMSHIAHKGFKVVG